MNNSINGLFFSAIAICASAFVSCGTNSEQAKHIVINELMTSNRTGLLDGNNNPSDWIEIKNTGNDTIDLKGFTLVVTKTVNKVKEGEDEEIDEIKEKSKDWTFPSVKIGPNECMVVFAAKNKDGESSSNALQANLKFPKSGGTVQLLAPDDEVISEVKFDEMEPDQSLALQPDSTYKATFWQSPGFENNREGYEASNERIVAQRQGQIVISELMSRAVHSYENWVELKNIGDQPVNLSAYKIARKIGKNEGWQLPDKTLAPGQVISFQLAGGKAKEGNNLQAPFKLGDKETIVLTKDGKFVDGMNAKLTPYGGSIGRQSGGLGLYYFATPTRNADNGANGRRYITEMPEWDQKPGIYKDTKKVVLKLKNPSQKVHYTLDGSEPTMSSPVLKDSIVITKPTVVRSFAEGDSKTMRSNIATGSYLVGVEHDIPVISISLNRADFYDHNKGIYADGPGYGGDFPYSNANFWKNWTKKAYFELFDDKDGFASDCGLKIFGGFSRALAKKSLRIKFRGEFGDAKVKYDFFNTGEPMDFEDLVLRSGSQDYNKYMIKDEFFTSLAQSGSNSILTQMYRPVAVYVNAEYFGLYYLREKIDKNFVARKLNLPDDNIDVFLSGPSPYMEMVNKIANMDMTNPDNFEYARKNIDFESLIDYKIGNIYSGKWDAGNIRHARSRDPKSDKKWRFVFYDIDASWGAGGQPSMAFFLSTTPGVVKPDYIRHNILINRLLKNKEFRQLFLERLSYLLTNTYSAENTTAHFDNFISQIRQEMKQNCKRWPKLTYEQWEKNIAEFRSRLLTRPQAVLKELRTYLSITDAENKKYFSHLGY